MDKWDETKQQQKANILWSVIVDASKIKHNNFGLTEQEKRDTNEITTKISNVLVGKENAMQRPMVIPYM